MDMSKDWFIAKAKKDIITLDEAQTRGWTMREYLLHHGYKEEDLYSDEETMERMNRFLVGATRTPRLTGKKGGKR